MKDFFPIPSHIDGLEIATGERDRLRRPITKRNEKRWHEIGAERDAAVAIVLAWRDAAVNDGWTIRPTYPNEELARAASLERIIVPHGLFKANIITRPNVLTGDRWTLGGGELSIWGPDSLTIKAPLIYPGLLYFEYALVTCPHCHKGPNHLFFDNVEIGHTSHEQLAPVVTRRYSFAGRACMECMPELKAKHEKPGWCD